MAHEAGKQLATMQKMSPRFGCGSVYPPLRHALSCQHTLSGRVAHTKSGATSIFFSDRKTLVNDVSEDQTRVSSDRVIL